jgi:Ca2+ transporting ATPase
MALHFMILYVPFMRGLFQITPLNWVEWRAVLLISAPVLVIDEVLKWISMRYIGEYSRLRSAAQLMEK